MSNNVENGFRQAIGRNNVPFSNGINTPNLVDFAITPAASNITEIAITIGDALGEAVPQALLFNVLLSDAASGEGLTATAASGTVQAKSASGEVISILVAKKALLVQSLATGIFTLEITDTAKTGFFIVVENPTTGLTEVSRQLVTADYGA